MGRRRKIEEVDGFLKLTIKVKHQVSGDEKDFIQTLNHSLSPQDLKFTIEDDLFCAYLAAFDPDSFRDILEDARRKTGITKVYEREGLSDPVSSLLEEILSIGSYGIRYGKRIYIGYADERKVSDRKEKESTRGIHYYTRDHQFSHDRNPIPKGRENTIVCGDSEDVLRSFPDNCIDLIVTSPPYNFGMEYDQTDDGVDWNAYLDKLFRVFTEGIRVLTYGGRFIVNVQPLFSDYIPLHHLISSFFMQQKMIWKGEILWEKNNYNCKYTSWGSWKSPSSPYLKYTWEFIEVFCKGDLKKTGRKEDIDITDEEFKSWVVAKWSIGPERRMKQYDHPAMFPEELVERCMKLFSYKGDIVLDPFSGAGTTATVATRLGRRYIGIDVSEEYCATARERIAKERKSGIQSNLI
ncbi:DNA-methyltransferase [Methanospirillum lacunae]|uniref:Type II methyltransferase n=1 Tax=Methanospirillum lacunae TaxID=668570 RepID=A0A2V2N0A5_9EURY|nr:site-specific DNA-methyltransferase [Methanospirillum lacunae]PWR73804.1 DNA methylase [Methanospirillum lacunae]